jgi:sec-independent protein translocase protein TatC
MPFLDHLEELRWRILRSLAAVLVGVIIGYVLVTQLNVLLLLIRPVEPFLSDGKLVYLSPTDPFMITLRLALTVGLILAVPIITYEVWGFVSPALLPREKRAIIPALYAGVALFGLGVALAYSLVLPLSLKFFQSFLSESLEANITAAAYLSFVVKLLVAFGVMFELPVVILVLSLLGIVDAKFLAAQRRYALLFITVAASMITPADIVSTFFLMAPLLILYECSIMMAKLVERRRRRREAEAEAELSEEPAGAQ